MVREIPFEKIGDYVEAQYEKLLRAAVLEADSLLKQASPVDTGRFRASWQVGENSADGGKKPPGNYSQKPQIERLGYSKEKAGNVYSVHNNLPYAEFLANGSSPQQPEPGWVKGIAKDLQSRVKTAANRIGKQS